MARAAYSSIHSASISMQVEAPTRGLIEYGGGGFNPPIPSRPKPPPPRLSCSIEACACLPDSSISGLLKSKRLWLEFSFSESCAGKAGGGVDVQQLT